jgi:hypothetical protein
MGTLVSTGINEIQGYCWVTVEPEHWELELGGTVPNRSLVVFCAAAAASVGMAALVWLLFGSWVATGVALFAISVGLFGLLCRAENRWIGW